MKDSTAQFGMMVFKFAAYAVAVFGGGWGLAILSGAPDDKAMVVGMVTFCAFLLGRGSRQ